MTLPADMVRRHGCGAKALHAIVVDEACLLEGCQGLLDLLICARDVSGIRMKQ